MSISLVRMSIQQGRKLVKQAGCGVVSTEELLCFISFFTSQLCCRQIACVTPRRRSHLQLLSRQAWLRTSVFEPAFLNHTPKNTQSGDFCKMNNRITRLKSTNGKRVSENPEADSLTAKTLIRCSKCGPGLFVPCVKRAEKVQRNRFM